jgi:hypothetical protein
VAAVSVIDAISSLEIGGSSLTARVTVEEFVGASRGGCTGRSLRSSSASVGQITEVVPLYRGVLTADVDRGVCWRPREGEEVSRVSVEERVNDIERGQVLRTPDLFHSIGEGSGPDNRKEGQLTRTVLSPVDRLGDLRRIKELGRNIPEELNSQCLSGAYSRARTLPV